MRTFNIFLLIFLLFIPEYFFSQNVRAISITNKDNANYTEIAGTNLKLLIPDGFVSSNTFLGYSDEMSGCKILFTELSGEVYKNFFGLDKGKLFEAGVLSNKQTFYLINDFDALFVDGIQASEYGNYYKYILMIGNISYTYVITASIPQFQDEKTREKIKNCLLSVIFNPKEKYDDSKNFDFTIDTLGTNFLRTQSVSNSFVFTEDGILPSNSTDKTTLIVNKLPFNNKLDEKNVIKLTQELFDKFKLTYFEQPQIKNISINNMQAYQIYGIGMNETTFQKVLFFLTLICNENNYYAITANTIGNFDNNLVKFKKIVESFRIK
ncbi:MAG: hypothetical protein LBV69_11805 [Bacteroidales bacterium]|jgi:hypothetical protein|nr:hypothetical protein [Bacteroidales bacterium]